MKTTITSTPAVTDAPEMISGGDALAMFVCVIGVFVVFSIMATITMRHMPSGSEGTLVVEEDLE